MTTIRERAEQYLAMRRALGFKLTTFGHRLFGFVTYLEAQQQDVITTEAALAWATGTQRSTDEVVWSRRLMIARIFARHMAVLDPATEIPPADVLPHHYRRVTPHLYTDAELAALLRATDELLPALRALTWRTLLGLLAVTGLRTGEACRLDDAAWKLPVHPRVERVVHEQVGEQRGDRRPLRGSLLARHEGAVWHLHRRFQPPLDVEQHPSLVGVVSNRFQQQIMRDAVEEGPDVKIQHPVLFPTTLTCHSQRVMGAAPRTVAVTVEVDECGVFPPITCYSSPKQDSTISIGLACSRILGFHQTSHQ